MALPVWIGEAVPDNDGGVAIRCIAYAPPLGMLLALNTANTARAWTSLNGGCKWTFQGAIWPGDLNGDGYANAPCQNAQGVVWDPVSEQFLAVVCVGKSGSPPPDDHSYLLLCASLDGETWTRTLIQDIGHQTLAPTANWCVAMDGGMLVAAGTIGGGTYVLSAPVGLSAWTLVAVPAGMEPGAIAHGNGLWVVVGNGDVPVITATDPTATDPGFPSPPNGGWVGHRGFEVGYADRAWGALAIGPSGFVVGCIDYVADAQNVMSSVDGDTWTLQTTPQLRSDDGVPNGWLSLVYAAPYGIVAGLLGCNQDGDNNHLHATAVSTDNGATWTFVDVPSQFPPFNNTGGITALCYAAAPDILIAGDSGEAWTAGAVFAFIATLHAACSFFYHNPDTSHYQCSAVDPGAPWTAADPTLAITTVDPTSGPEAGGTPITITGTGFADDATVTIAGVALVDLDVVDETTITGVTPAGTAGLAADVVVGNPVPCGGVASAAGAFVYAGTYDDGADPAGGVMLGGTHTAADEGIGADMPVGPIDVESIGCATETTIVCNLALARLGVNRQIADITSDSTQEAILARLHYNTDVDVVLSAFPWEFARRYNGLVVVSGSLGSPVNSDWAFAYRRPADCVFERRIVGARGAAVNPTSPPFALSSDTDGGLILSNEPNAVLEYTYRPACAASAGDALFIEALIWKVGASLASALTRIAGKSDECFKQFEAVVARAYDVQRPGNPGPPPAAATIDTSAPATAANLSVVNRALIRIGARTIGAITDQSREATSVRLLFEDELQTVLRDFPWDFATRYEELAAVAGPVTWDDALVQVWDVARTYEKNDVVSRTGVVYYALRETVGDAPESSASDWTTTEPLDANADWIRAYRTPADLLSPRRLVKPTTRRVYDDNPFPFKVGTDDGGELIYTDTEQAILEYTARIDAAVLRGDALFKDAFAWRLASDLALTLAQVDPDEVEQRGRGTDATAAAGKQPAAKANSAAARQRVAQWALAQYASVMERAKDANANENQAEPTGDAPWIEERGGGHAGQRTQTRAPWDK